MRRPKPASAWRPAFLDALRKTGNVSLACDVADVPRRTVYTARERSARFAAEWREACEIACDALEAEARRRGAVGVNEPVYYQGEVVGHITKYSDTLLIFLLKAHRPEKFRDNIHHSGQVDTGAREPFQVEIVRTKPENTDGDGGGIAVDVPAPSAG